jgi:hypothetical protein
MSMFLGLSITGVVGLNPTRDIGVSLMGGLPAKRALPIVSNESVSVVLDWNRLESLIRNR